MQAKAGGCALYGGDSKGLSNRFYPLLKSMGHESASPTNNISTTKQPRYDDMTPSQGQRAPLCDICSLISARVTCIEDKCNLCAACDIQVHIMETGCQLQWSPITARWPSLHHNTQLPLTPLFHKHPQVHSANPIANRHTRWHLCAVCGCTKATVSADVVKGHLPRLLLYSTGLTLVCTISFHLCS